MLTTGGQQQSLQQEAQKQSTDYAEVLLGINNLFNRAVKISQRQIKFDETQMSKEDSVQAKIKIISEVISDLQQYKQEVID